MMKIKSKVFPVKICKATVVAILSLFMMVNTTFAVTWDTGSSETSNPATIIVDSDIDLTAITVPTGEVILNLNDASGPAAAAYTTTLYPSMPAGTYVPPSYDPDLPVEAACGTTSGKFIYRCDSNGRKAYTFSGWYDAPTGGNKISGTSPILTESPLTLYAQWEAVSVRLIFDKNTTDAVTNLTPTEKNVVFAQPYGALPLPTRQGYKFDGWFTEATAGTKVTSSTVSALTSDTTIYAHWSARPVNVTYSVVDTGTLDLNTMGDYSWMNVTATYDGDITLSNTVGTTAAGFEFTGWGSVNAVNNTADIGAKGATRKVNWPTITCPGGETPGSCNTTIYSHWESLPLTISSGDYTVTFKPDWGSPDFYRLFTDGGTGNNQWSINSIDNNGDSYLEARNIELGFKGLGLKQTGGVYTIPSGDYHLNIKADDLITGRSAEKDITVSVLKKEVPIPSAVNTIFTYDKTVHTLEDNLGDEFSEYVTKQNISKTDAGEYIATYTLKYPNDSVWSDGSNTVKTISWKIDKAINEISINPASKSTLASTPFNVNVTVNNLDNLGYSIGSYDNANVSIRVSGNSVTVTALKDGVYIVPFISDSNNNYLSKTVNLEVLALEGNFSYTFVDSYIYDGLEHEFIVNSVPAGNVTYGINGGAYSNVTPKRTNVGTDIVGFTLQKAGYSTINRTVEFSVTPFTITDSMVSWTTNPGCSGTSGSYYCDYNEEGNHPQVNVNAPIRSDYTANLVEGVDYDVSYSGSVTGASYIVIVGKGNYTGRVVKDFTIGKGKIRYDIYGDDLRLPNNREQRAELVTDEGSAFYGQTHLSGNSSGFAGYSYRTYSSVPGNGNIHFTSLPEQAVVRFGTTEGTYDLKEVPQYRDAGEYTVYFKISLINFDDVVGSIKIVIEPLKLKVPSADSLVCYSGKTKSPTWVDYNPLYMAIGGQTSGIEEKSYVATFDLLDKKNTAWENPSTPSNTFPQSVTWSIQGVCDDDAEIVAEIFANYGQYCTLEVVQDGKTSVSFKRPGFVQTGWVEERDGRSIVYELGSDVINLREKQYDSETDNDDGRKDLYALWQTANYYISVDFDGGNVKSKDYVIIVDKEGNKTNVSANPDINYVTEETGAGSSETGVSGELRNNPTVIAYNSYFSLITPTKPGYSFKGWSITNMDESTHVIGSEITDATSYFTEESFFFNLTSIANDTVYLKAVWEMNDLWVENDEQTVTALPTTQLLRPLNRAMNGSGSYEYIVVGVSPLPTFADGSTHPEPSYGFEVNPNTMQVKVPALLDSGTYTIKINVRDAFTTQTKNFFLTLTVKDPTVKIENNVYSYSLDFMNPSVSNAKWNGWYNSSFNTSNYDKFTKSCLASNTATYNSYVNGYIDRDEYLGVKSRFVNKVNDNR